MGDRNPKQQEKLGKQRRAASLQQANPQKRAVASPGRTVEELAAYRKFANREMAQGLGTELAAAGFGLVEEPERTWPNALVTFPTEPDDDDWARLRAVMTARPLLPNPGYKGPKERDHDSPN